MKIKNPPPINKWSWTEQTIIFSVGIYFINNSKVDPIFSTWRGFGLAVFVWNLWGCGGPLWMALKNEQLFFFWTPRNKWITISPLRKYLVISCPSTWGMIENFHWFFHQPSPASPRWGQICILNQNFSESTEGSETNSTIHLFLYRKRGCTNPIIR